MNKEQILTNLNVALQVLKAADEKTVDLSMYVRTTECGTLHCLAGLLVSQPHFQRLGWHWDDDNETPWPEICGRYLDDEGQGLTTEQLGPDPWNNLFAPRYGGRRDFVIFAKHGRNISDKDLAEQRLLRQIAAVEAEL